jgi:hypothetical protein
MVKKIDIFDIRSTSNEAKQVLRINECDYTIVEWQAIVGRLYAKAARFRRVTKKHEAWRKAAKVRGKVNSALMAKQSDTIIESNVSFSEPN